MHSMTVGSDVSPPASRSGLGDATTSDNCSRYSTRDLERENDVKRELFMDFCKLSPGERCARALARIAANGRAALDSSAVTYTADKWVLTLSLPAFDTTISVDPSATTLAEIAVQTADLLRVDADHMRMVDRDGNRLPVGVALPRDEGGKRHRLATPGDVALARTGRVGPDDTLSISLLHNGGGGSNINEATENELAEVVDDERLASRIISNRNTQGAFRGWDELRKRIGGPGLQDGPRGDRNFNVLKHAFRIYEEEEEEGEDPPGAPSQHIVSPDPRSHSAPPPFPRPAPAPPPPRPRLVLRRVAPPS